jgi:hypothetical protein
VISLLIIMLPGGRVQIGQSSDDALFIDKNGRWRASSTDAGDANGVDGDGKTAHVRSIWDTCYFTDGTYDQYRNQGDSGRGMQLLVWNHYKNQNRTCELTLID